MNSPFSFIRPALAAVSLGLLVVCLSGCGDAPPARFHLNLVELKHGGLDPVKDQRQQQVLANTLTALFGTPDEPYALPETGLSLEKLKRAAGPVTGAEGAKTGLYRLHCVHCHGISGDGAGPTAQFLNPYPRDYRHGWYKFKSTEGAYPPTDADLKKTLTLGIPGTAMPSFRLLDEDEMQAVIEYVKYLSLRGQTELRLAAYLNENWEPESGEGFTPEKIAAAQKKNEAIFSRRDAILAGDDSARCERDWTDWKNAEKRLIKVLPRPTKDQDPEFELAKSIEIGRKLFYQIQSPKVAGGGCIACHGPSAMGDDGAVRYDKWQENVKPAEDYALGALPKRVIVPRNIRTGIFRGGRRPLDLYYRVFNGINGTPMPDGKAIGSPGVAAGEKAADNSKLIWHIVDYIINLPFEPESDLSTDGSTVHRDNL